MNTTETTMIQDIVQDSWSTSPPLLGNVTNYFDASTSSELLVQATLAPGMVFNDGHILSIVGYSILMLISSVGNISVLLITILRVRHISRINLMLINLVIADLLVTFLTMPLEIAWNATVSWKGGDVLCRIMMFFRAFGLFLSGFIIMSISLDRYYAVIKPLAVTNADRRNKYFLLSAWLGSTLCSLPQVVIFHLEQHPKHTWYLQCKTYSTLSSTEVFWYWLFGFVFMYGAPLLTIIFCYTSIIHEICRKSNRDGGETCMRRSSSGNLNRAKVRTLKMTVIIVCVFLFCWTPYYIICILYWIDKDLYEKLDTRIPKGLYIFAGTNSCFNPLVYGWFNLKKRRRTDDRHRAAMIRRNTIALKSTHKMENRIRHMKGNVQL